MADNTSIEWTDATWNPITGCAVVSPGCTNCYAMKLAGTRLRNHPSREGLTKDTKAGPVWTGEVRLNEEWLKQPLRWKKPRKIFVCAHGDLFAEGVPDKWIDKVFAIMALAPQHTFQVLTKRAERMRDYMRGLEKDRYARLAAATMSLRPLPAPWTGGMIEMAFSDTAGQQVPVQRFVSADALHNIQSWPMPNVWAGVSVEDQPRAEQRIHDLLETPAAVRWVSAEPLLGPVNLTVMERNGPVHTDALTRYYNLAGQRVNSTIDWVVAGGESGPDARPMHPDWARSLRDQCAAAGVPFLFKQWGEWVPQVGAVDGWTIPDDPEISRIDHRDWEDDRWGEPYRPMWCDDIEDDTVSRVGKRHAGRKLDGVVHDGFPSTNQQEA